MREGTGTVGESPRERADAAASLDELMVRVAGGDREAFARVYDRVAGSVLRITGLVLGDASGAEAACETAFLDVWRQAPRFDPARISATAWIISLAQRHAAGHPVR